MRRALVLLALPALACGSTTTTTAIGEFSGPGGVAATGAGDRDLLFIANSGRDGLRALQLCNAPLLADGGIRPDDTCPTNENGQFIPAPIRVFPATIETGDRPMRVAGARLERADGTAAGVALVAGADSTVAVVDARSLVEAQAVAGTIPTPVAHLDVGDRTVDVVAANPVDPELDLEIAAQPGAKVPAFVATQSELLVLDVGLDPNGFAQLPSIRARCALAPVVPTRIAIVPGSPDLVYVADGLGDGVVSIATSSIAGGSCTMHRISAGGRSVRSLSVSPRWYDESGAHGPGDLLLLVVEPSATSTPGEALDPGGLLFASSGTEEPEGIFPIPPFPLSDTTSERMRPLSLHGPGLIREGTFLRSVKPRASPLAPDLAPCGTAPCTPLYVSQPSTSPSHLFSLLAVATASDGVTYFLDPGNRRFVNMNFYAAEGDASIVPGFAPPTFSAPSSTAPTMVLDPASLEPGVTHTAAWRAIWHSPIPGLDRRGGTLTPTGNGTLLLTLPAVDLSVWQNDTAIALAVGDFVSFGAFLLASDSSAACTAVATGETPYRFELPILAVNSGSLELGELPDTAAGIGFHPDGCSELGAVAEVRTGGNRPWLVFDGFSLGDVRIGATIRGRVEPDGTFVAHQRRFDYPRTAYDPGSASTPPQAGAIHDVAFTFTITGTTNLPRNGFFWTTSSILAPVSYFDAIAAGGLATAVYAYSSPRAQSLVFTSITGGNELLQADPSQLSTSLATGLVAYR